MQMKKVGGRERRIRETKTLPPEEKSG